jgi:hypothetical protein
MADSKLTALNALTTVTTDDLLYAVDGSTVTSRKVTFDNLQKSITVVGGAAGVSAQGDVNVPVTNTIYFGSATVDGSFAITISAGNLSFQKRIGGSWVEVGNVGA